MSIINRPRPLQPITAYFRPADSYTNMIILYNNQQSTPLTTNHRSLLTPRPQSISTQYWF